MKRKGSVFQGEGVDERGLPPATKKKSRFSQQVSVWLVHSTFAQFTRVPASELLFAISLFFAFEVHLIKALCDFGCEHLVPLVAIGHQGGHLRSDFWRVNRMEIFELMPSHFREKFDKSHGIMSEFECALSTANEKDRWFKQSLGHLHSVLLTPRQHGYSL